MAVATVPLVALLVGCTPVGKLSYKTENGKTTVLNGTSTLAVYNHAGNTFTEFWFDGVNILGGFSSGTPGTNGGGPITGHSADYPFGWKDANGTPVQWLGFWAGYNYFDKRWKFWTGIAGNPFAQQSFQVTQPRDDVVVLHVVLLVGLPSDPLFDCEVDYFIKPHGIGVKAVINIRQELQPLGLDDTGGQFIMTQVDCDLDPNQPDLEASQPDLYYKLALNDSVVSIDPFAGPNGYNTITPSNIYADQNIPAPPQNKVTQLPNTALVAPQHVQAFISPFSRPSRSINLAVRIDLAQSVVPALEYYCEYNGERDYLNFLLSPAIGTNRLQQTVPKGTTWTVRGDLVPWKGADPKVLYATPFLYE